MDFSITSGQPLQILQEKKIRIHFFGYSLKTFCRHYFFNIHLKKTNRQKVIK